jgi:hypothetical protein
VARLIRGADGRQWILNRRMTWSVPASVDDFEHDMRGGFGATTAMVLVLVLLLIALAAWRPKGVILPSWLLIPLVLVLAVLAVRWLLRRPCTLVAETEYDPIDERPPEHWVGTVHGLYRAKQQMSRVAHDIENDAMPHVDGPLHEVD